MSNRKVGPEDHYIAKRLRTFRLARGISQETLADGLGITFQQVQKYEKASNRISAGTLVRAAAILKVPVADFFDKHALAGTADAKLGTSITEFTTTADGLAIIRAFAKIDDSALRRCFVKVVEQIALRA